jgi:hypothetical protein
VLCEKVHYYDTKSTLLAKGMVYLKECTALNISKLEDRMLGSPLFCVNKFIMDNFFNVRK